MTINKPTILIYANHPNQEILKEICAGIEEEGVLYKVVMKEETNISRLCYESANDSILGSGIGMNGTRTELSLRSLPEGGYVFHSEKPTYDQARNLGANAARAVKRMPFKDI